MQSDMEILTDMLSGDESPFGEIIEKGQDISYYSSFGIYLIKIVQISNLLKKEFGCKVLSIIKLV